MQAHHVRPVLGEHAHDGQPDEPAEYDQRHRDPVDGMVDVVAEVVEAGVADLDLKPAVARLLHHVAQLVRQLAGNATELPDLVLRPERDPPRREALRNQPTRVRARDLEDVEVGMELDAHGPERRDRLVEGHEPARQPQVERVDQVEPSRITSIGSMLEMLDP